MDIDKLKLLKCIAIATIIVIGYMFLEKLTGVKYYDIVVVISSIFILAILFYVGFYIKIKAAYATGVGLTFILLVLIVVVWLVVGLIVHWLFGKNILDLYIDLENIRLIWLN